MGVGVFFLGVASIAPMVPSCYGPGNRSKVFAGEGYRFCTQVPFKLETPLVVLKKIETLKQMQVLLETNE